LFCFKDNMLTDDGAGMALATQRFCAVAWHLFPDTIILALPKDLSRSWHKAETRPITLAELAGSLSTTPSALRTFWKQFSKRWPMAIHVQRVRKGKRP